LALAGKRPGKGFLVQEAQSMARKTKEQRRRHKKQKRQRRESERRQETVLPYRGTKYRNEQTVLLHVATEAAILECDVMSRRRLTDHHVRRALSALALGIRQGTLPAQPPGADSDAAGGTLEDLVMWSIRGHWRDYVREHGDPREDMFVGVLRSVLASVETWGSIAPNSRGYLKYIEGFLKEVGVGTRELTPAETRELGLDRVFAHGDSEDDEDDWEDED
jgi:hypothetical protein